MQNTIVDVEFNSTLKGLDSKIGKIPAVQRNSVIKIKQHNHFIYVIYQPNEQLRDGKAELPTKLCQFNGISPGPAQVEIANGVGFCRQLKVYVSQLDWQIINNKSQKLEFEFLNQVSLVWPAAIIPLFYDRNNSVKLRVECEAIGLLQENSELQILVQPQESKQEGPSSMKQQMELAQYCWHETQFGNINTVKVAGKGLFCSSSEYEYRLMCVPKNDKNGFPFDTDILSIKQQLQFIKLQSRAEKRDPIIIPVQIQAEQTRSTDEISLNSFMNRYWNIESCSTKIEKTKTVTHPKQYKLEFLLNSIKQFKIELTIANREETLQSDLKVKNNFIDNFLQQLKKSSHSITIYSKIPFVFQKRTLGFVSFQQKGQLIGDPLAITFQGEKADEKQIRQKLARCIVVKNCYYSWHEIGEKSEAISLLRLNKYQQSNKQRTCNMFQTLYKTAYEQQIKQTLSFLQNPNNKYILISSFSNNGKTIMNKVLRENQYETLYIDMAQMNDASLTLGDLHLYLELSYQVWESKYIFFDNFDSICYTIDAGDLHRRQERLAAKLLLRKIQNFTKTYDKICILTAKNEANIDEEFLNYQLVKLKNPNLNNRVKVLQAYGEYSQAKVQQIAQASQSMSFGEFSKFVITGNKDNDHIQAQKHLNNFSKLAGVHQAKQTIRSMINRPLKYNHIFKKLPVKLSRGVLLYGGSGTGKTAIGQALADQFQMKFFSIKGSDILSKYIGGSEAAVRDIFEKAMTVSPSIVFFDEFETIVPRRNSSNTGVTDRVVNQFLCYLDGVASVQGVFIVISSSRPQLIDPALLRPGRIDSHIFLDYPTSEQRRQLLDLYKNSIQFEASIDQVVKLTENYSYSDMIGLIKELRIKKSALILKDDQLARVENFKYIETEFLQQTISNFKISASELEKQKQKKSYLAFKNGDVPDISKQKAVMY